MPEMPDVVAGEHVESSWGNDIRDRTVQRYQDEVTRDAENPLPVAGDLAWVDSIDRLQVYTGTTWQEFVNLTGDTMTGALSVVDALYVKSSNPGVVRPQVNLGETDDITESRFAGVRRLLVNGAEGAMVWYKEDGGTAFMSYSPQSETGAPKLFQGLWSTASLGAGWVNYAQGFQTARYRISSTGWVTIQGLIKDGTTAINTVLLTVPAHMRPAETIMMPTLTWDNALSRLDMYNSGQLRIAMPGVNPQWLSISVAYQVDVSA